MICIYVLQLEKGKYYVGKTKDPYFRIKSHFNSNGSKWTQLYKPLKILELKRNCDDYDEDKVTRQYMDKYGIDNVRGGSFVSVKLDKSVIHTLQQMEIGTNDKCFKCGEKGHFAKDCNYEDDEDEDEEVIICKRCGEIINKKLGCSLHGKWGGFRRVKKGYFAKECKDEDEEVIICKRCGEIIDKKLWCSLHGKWGGFRRVKKGHFAKECKDEDEEWICDYCNKRFDTKKGCLFHENVYCKKNRSKTRKNSNIIDCGSDDDYNFSDDEF